MTKTITLHRKHDDIPDYMKREEKACDMPVKINAYWSDITRYETPYGVYLTTDDNAYNEHGEPVFEGSGEEQEISSWIADKLMEDAGKFARNIREENHE